jgi:hypothetical protein
MTTGGKGDKPRPYSIPLAEFDNRWDTIFGKKNKEDNTGVTVNEYQDVLSTEDAIIGVTNNEKEI